MKKTSAFFAVILFASILLSGCLLFNAEFIAALPELLDAIKEDAEDSNIPEGYIRSEEHFDESGFMDYTDYCKYYYDSTPVLEESRFHMVSESEVEEIKGYFSDFQRWMEIEDRLEEYDFDDRCITEGDYVFIKTKAGEPIGTDGHVYGKYDFYTVYYFDVDSCVLFYIHNDN